MRLLLTAVVDGSATDLAIDCDEDARVRDLALEIGASLHLSAPSVVQPLVGNPLGLVGERPSTQAPVLWLGGQALDQDEPVSTSRLRHGVVLGIDSPTVDVLREPFGAVEVRVVGGPGAGRVRRLAPGSYTLGTSPDSALVLPDPSLPPVAARVDVDVAGKVTLIADPTLAAVLRPAPARRRPLSGPIVVPRDGAPTTRRRFQRRGRAARAALLAEQHDTIDPQSDVPLIHLDRRPVTEAVPWPVGDALVIGSVLLELAAVTEADASLSPTHGGLTLDYNRPPRLLPPDRHTAFALPAVPQKPDKMPLPLALMLAPAALSGGMYLITHSIFSLLFAAMMPVMAFSTFASVRRQSKRQYKKAQLDYARRARRVREDAYAALVAERSLRRHDLADPAVLLMTASGPRVRLWERRPTDPDWLFARIGTADAPSAVTMTDPAREKHEGDLTWTAPDVPVGVPLDAAGVTGVAGPDAVRRAVARWVVAQAAVLHSPADLEIAVLADQDGGREWSWLRWLPHARPADEAGPLTLAGTDTESVATLVRYLNARLQSAGAGEPGGPTSRPTPILVVLDGARRLRLLTGMVSLLKDGPGVGIHFLCLDVDQRQLPEECRAVIAPSGPDGAELRISRTGEEDIEGVRPDLVDIAWCERVARAVAPIRDVSSEDLAGSLPSSSRLLTVLGMEQPNADDIASRWLLSGGRTTRAVVGEGLDGPFSLDIRSDGPHGLIAGTTGSGKSELLQTIIASLAVGNRPDEMTFVLIDYKGGAAFKDCVRLPHTVGMVTDLDGHLTTRALESLGAELRRREHQLAGADAKDIEDYLAGRSPADEPMPRLLIVIDEFAALAAELPDFVVGLVDIARRGRSLGVHLILATQRPAGVVSAEIKSNTNLRIALRVTDANDSQDVIESKEAAAISKAQPGRAYARLGHSSLLPFQSARVGGRPRGSDDRAAVRSRPLAWESMATNPAQVDTADQPDDMSVLSDLSTLVAALREASDLAGVATPPSPWLPALADTVTLDDAGELSADQVGGGDVDVSPLIFGVVDVPSEQRRGPARWDPTGSGHLSIVGAPRTGRSTALRAIAGAVARSVSPRDLHLYGVDCGNNALLPMLGLPHTGAVVTRDQPDRLARLTTRLLATISERQQLLAEQGYADLREQRAASAPEDRLPYLVVLFDRWEGFVAAFDSVDAGKLIEQWTQILQEGAGAGVTVALTADRSALAGRISMLTDDKLLLRLVDPSDFVAIGLRAKEVPEHMPAGRGFRSDGAQETQIALLSDDPSGSAQVAALQALGREAAAAAGSIPARLRPFRVDALPNRITLTEARALDGQLPSAPDDLPIAVGGDSLALLGVNPVEHGPGLLIGGARRSGRSSALRVLADSAVARGWPVVAITPRQSLLRTPTAGVEVFTLDSGKDEVTAAVTALREAEHSLLLLDDLELLGIDGWRADLIDEHLGALRDRAAFVVGAGSLDDMTGVYRGPVVALKKSRSGVLLCPQTQNDGDLFGIRLPRSALGGPPLPGRGMLVRSGNVQGCQLVLPG